MAYYAIERLDDAYRATRSLLLPFDAGRWWRLAILALLVAGATGGFGGGGSSAGSAGTGGDGAWEGIQIGDRAVDVSEGTLLALALGLVALVLLVGLVIALLASIAEFAFVESLASERVALREYVGRFRGPGVRLFVFRVALALVTALVVAILVGLVVLAAIGAGPIVAVLAALVAVPLLIVAVLAAAVAERFTALFVVPTMMATDRGVLDGWRRFRPTLVADWRQYGVYALVAIGLNLVAGVVLATVVGIPAVVLALVFGAIFLAGLVIADAVLALGAAVMVLAVLGFLVCLLAVTAVVQVPIQTYLRYHALLVLGDTDAELDLVPDRREPLEGGGHGGGNGTPDAAGD